MNNHKSLQNSSRLTVAFPVGFIKSMSKATSIQEVLDIASYWVSTMVEADRTSVTLADSASHNHLKIYSLQGDQAIPLHTEISIEGTLVGKCFTERRVIRGRLIANNGTPNEQMLYEAGLRSYISAPLVSGDKCYGTLNAGHSIDNYYSDTHGLIVESMAVWLASQICILDKVRKNQILANTDFLTGLLNRRSFMNRAAKYFQCAEKPFALALLDVDFFKVINDTYGHDTGDFVLKEIAGVLKSQVGSDGLVARFGGEEFIILFDAMDRDKLIKLVKRCNQRMTAIQVQCLEGRVVEVSLSIGLTCSGATDNSLDVIVSRADKLLYQAKQNGRKQMRSDFPVETEVV